MSGSNETTGVNIVNSQYKGEGTVIAVIDTGLDLDHEAFQNAGGLVTEDNAKLKRNEMAALMGQLNAGKVASASDVYRSLKVPFAFNYADNNLSADHSGDTQGDHGTHVAGIAAGYMEDGEGKVTFSGVAPAAQLIIMKVFGANRAGQWSDILAAMEDASKLGADVINLSLGSPAGFSDSNSAAEENTAEVLDTLTKAGVVVCASAGNEYSAAYGNRYGGMSLASNPDNGIVGSPASYDESLAVASVANTTYSGQFLWVGDRKIAFTNNASADSRNILKLIPDGQEEVDKEFAILTDGSTMLTGTADEFDQYAESSGIAGKFVVVRRGQTFTETVQRAQDAGAIGLIVADHTEGSLSNMAENLDVNIPSVFISKADGDFLAGKKTGTITISRAVSTEPNVGAGQMSDFSSWGVTSDLKLKPEITTPGGNIYSTRDNGTYGNMSGTSMASPNMAGLAALAKQYINKNPEKFARYINDDQGKVNPNKLGDVITDLMMSSASPITDPNSNTFYSPRKQGAGLANIADATAAEAFLSVEGAPSAKLDLGDDEGKTGKYTMTFTVNSLSGETETYTLDTTALTEKILKDQQVEYQTYHWDEAQQKYTTETITRDFMANEPYELNGVTVTCSGDNVNGSTVTVPANSSTTVTVTLTLGDGDKSYLDQYPNGIYVDGFVQLLDADNDGGSDLSIPFLAFYGDWEQAPILDEGTWMDVLEDKDIYPSFGFSTAKRDSESIFSLLLETATPLGMPNMTNANQRELAETGYDYRPSLNLYNPTPDSGYDKVFCDISLLRNAKDVTMTLYGVKSGTTPEKLNDYEQLESYVDTATVYNTVAGKNYNKTYHDGSTVRDHSDYLNYRFYWNGTDTSGSILPDGTLVIAKVTATMGTGDDESGNRRSSFYFPVVIHTVPAKVTEMNFTSGPDGITVQIDDPNFVGSVMMGIYGLKSKNGEVDYFTSGELTGVGEDALPEQFTAGGGTVTFEFPYLWDKAYNIWTVYAELTDLSGGYADYYYHLVSWFDVDMDQTVLNEGRSLTLDYSAGFSKAYNHWEENTNIPGGHSYTVTSSDPDLLSVTDNGNGTVTLTASADAGLTQAKKVDLIFHAGVNRNFEERYTVTVLPYLLQKQIDEAQPGDTVYWTGGDLTDSVIIDKDLTLDLGGATLTSADGEAAIRVRSGNVTITNGTIRSSSGGLTTDGNQLLTTLNGEHRGAIRAEGGSVTLDGVTAEGAALTGQALVTHVSSAVDLSGGAALTVRDSELYGEYAVNNKVSGMTAGGAVTVEDGYLSGDVASVKSYTNADTVVDLGAGSVALDSDALYTEALTGGAAVNDLDFTGSFTKQSCTPYLYFDLTDPNEVAKWTATDATIDYVDGQMKVTANSSSAYIYRKLDQPVTLSGSQAWRIFFTGQSSSSLWNYVNVSSDGGASWSGNSGYLSGSNGRCNTANFSTVVTDVRVKFDSSGHWILMNGFGAFASMDDAQGFTSVSVATSTKDLTVLDRSALAQSAGLTTAEADGQLTVTAPEPVAAGTDGAFSYRWVPVSVTLTPETGEARTAEFADGTAALTPPEGAYTLSVNWSAEVSPSSLRQAELNRLQDPDYESKAAADLKSYLNILSGQLDLSADVEALRTLKTNLSGSMVEAAFKLRDERKIDTPLRQYYLNEYYAAYADEVAAFSGDEDGVIYQGVKGESESAGVYWAKPSTLTNPDNGATVAKNGFYSTINSDGMLSGVYVDENYSHLSAALAQAEAAQPLFQELQSLCASDAGLVELQSWWGANGPDLLDTALAVQKVIKDDDRESNVNFASTAAWDSTYGVYYDREAKVANGSNHDLWEYLDGDGVTSTDGKAVDAAMTVLREEGTALYQFIQAAGSFSGVTGTQRSANLLQQGKTQANGKSYAQNLAEGIAANASKVYALHEGEDGKQYLSAQGSGSVTYAAVALTSDHGQPASQTLYYPAGAKITLPTLTEVGWTHTGWTDGETTYNLTDPYTVPAEGASLTAVWEAGSVNYTLELYGADLTGGTYSSLGTVTVPAYTGQNIQLVQEDKLALPEAEGMPDLSGYVFDSDNEGNLLTATVAGDSKTVLKVYFDRASFTLTAGENTAEVTYGAPLTETLSTFTPVKEGHTFGGWYMDETLETPVSESNTMPAAPLTVYPKWTVDQYTITFETGEGTAVESITKDYGSSITAPDAPTRTGYTFGGWYTEESCTGEPYVFTTMPARSFTLYAKWTVDQHTITFVTGEGATTVEPITGDYGSSVTAPADPTRTGYTFAGWDKEIPATMPAENLTITAQWTVNQYTITFVTGEGGSTVEPITQNYGTTVTRPDDPTREGYTFTAWFTDKDCKNVYTFTTMPAENLTLYAGWQVGAYTLQFNSNGGSDAATIAADYGTPITLPTVTRTGYTFGGWYRDNTFTGDPVDFTTMPAENLTLYAKWTVNRYTITFVTGEGTPVEAITAYYGAQLTAPKDPTRTGYTFAGWDKKIPATMPAEDLTLTAQWTVNRYTITFETADGTPVDAITQDYGTAVQAPADPTRAGYTFAGWDKVIPETMPAENITITAQWTVNQYTITFETGEGTPVDAITADYGSKVTAPDAPTRTGYTFGGWYAEEDCSGEPYAFTTMPLDGVKLYAKWTVNSVTLTFDTGTDGPAVGPITQNYGTPVTLPAPEKTGYTFGGWYADADCSGQAVELTAMPAESATLHAKWTANSYTITFVTGEGSPVEAITQAYGTAVTAPDAPTRTGYTFGGWYTEEACENPYTFTTMPVGGITLYAKWTINSVTITFHSNGGSEVKPISGQYGDPLTEPDYPTLKGHSFLGWFTEEDLSGEKYTFETMPAENLELYAKWVLNQYRVSFDTDGGTELDDLMVDYGAKVPEPKAPVKSGYFFQGWSLDGQTYDFTAPMPDTNLVLTAVWLKDSALQDLIDQTEPGGTVSWTGGNFTTSVTIDKPLTLDLGGAVITGLAGEPVITSKPGAGQTVTIQNGTLVGGSDQGQPALMADGGDTVLRNMLCRGDSVEEDGTVVYNGSGADVHNNGNLTVYDSVLAGIYGINNGARGSYLGGGQIQLRSAVLLGLANDMYSDDTLLVPNTALTLPEQDFSAQLREGDQPQAVEELDQLLTVRRERIVIPAFQSDDVSTSYTFRDGMLEVTVTVPQLEELAFASRWIPVQLDNGGQTAPFTQQADGTFTASLPASGGVQNCTIRFQSQLSFSSREMEQIVNLPLALASGSLTQIGQFADLETRMYEQSQTAKSLMRDTYDQITAAAADPTNSLLINLFGIGKTITNMQDAIVAMGGSYVTGTGDSGLIGQLEDYHSRFSAVSGEAARLAFLCENYSNIRDVVGRIYTQAEKLYQNASDPLLYSLVISNNLVSGYDQKVEQLKDVLKQFDDMLVELDGNRLLVLGDWQADTTGTLCDKVLAAAAVQGGYLDVPAGSTLTDGSDDTAATLSLSAQVVSVTCRWNDGSGKTTVLQGLAGDSLSAPAEPTRTGYTFGGWYTDESCTGEPYVFTVMPEADLELYAKWTANRYTITFETGEGTPVAPMTADYGTAIQAPAAPTREGYSFIGWYTEETCENLYTFATMPAENITLYAKWQAGQYTITFVTGEGATAVAPIVGDYGTPVTAPDAPTRTGYTFAGWDQEIPATMPAGDLTITAQWTVNQYTITFVTGEGTAVEPITQDYGTTVTKPDDPTREGYAFTGWYTDPDCTGEPYAFTTMPAEDLTLYAKWQAGQYTITFDSQGGSQVETIAADYGQTVTVPTAPTRTGYTFGGWYTEAGCENLYTFTTMPAQSFTLYAKWTVNQYTITFETGEGTAVAPITQDYGTTVTKPDDPTREGYAFTGWYTDPDCTGEPYAFTTMPAEDLTLYAKWQAGQYTITFDSQGGSQVETIAADYGQTVTAPTAPTRTGYTFGGWYTEAGCENIYTFTTMPAQSFTLYAKWTVNQYTITFETGEGATAVEPITADYGTAIQAPAAPTREGYIFDGWSPELPATMPAENLTLTARWSSEPSGPSGGGTVTVPKYPVNLPQTVDNGTVTADRTTAEAGQTVTLTAKPDQGYTLDSISVTDGSGKLLQLTADGDTYRFTMPGGKVTVAVRFAPLPVELPFTDVDEADWFHDAVSYVYGRELMTGISDTLFAPDQHLTRGMITTVLWRLEGSPAAGTGTVFTDVAEDAWYAQAVNWAAAQGIVDGYGNGKFGPEDDITREQLAAILYRYARYLDDETKAEGDLSGYPDGAQTSDWAVESMTWAVGTGLISGKNGGLLDPTGTATRSEVAALLQRFCESRGK